MITATNPARNATIMKELKMLNQCICVSCAVDAKYRLNRFAKGTVDETHEHEYENWTGLAGKEGKTAVLVHVD